MKKIFMFIICLLLCSCTLSSTVFKEVVIDDFDDTSTKITLTMVGDALIHSYIYKDAYENGIYNFKKMFSEIESEFQDSNLLYYNAETIIGGEARGYSGYPRFNTPEEFGRTMLDMGFNLVSRANNHTLDMGEAGILNACNFWNKYPHILTTGSACTLDERNSPKIMEMNGITYSLLSYTTHTNGLKSPNDYYVNIYSDEQVKIDINKVKDADLILIAMHWGDEYKTIPNEEQIRISKFLSSLDVDIVIGTHPHVIEPIMWMDDTLIIYSLGNFISSQTNVNDYSRLIGLMVNIDIIKTVTDKETKVILNNLNTELIYTYYKNKSNYKVIPFSKIDDNILNNYKDYEIKYNSIIKYYDQTIQTK